MGLGSGKTIGKDAVLGELARVGRLAFVTCAVAVLAWALVAPARGATEPFRQTTSNVAARVTVAIDGLAGSVLTNGTVADALRATGVARGGADRLSAPTGAPVVVGQRIKLDRGMPVTLVDGGTVLADRSPRGTVADLLAAASISLGPLDRVEPALDAAVVPGAIVRVTRIAERQDTVTENVPFGVRTVSDPNADRGREVVLSAGKPGVVVRTYLVQSTDGVESARSLLTSTTQTAPVDEVRSVGTRVVAVAGFAAVPATGDIPSIIRAAAAAQGADADQLLRVAWCESRYNPNAVNSSSGASGLFQFMPATWAANSVRAGFAGASVFDPVAAANVAAWMFSRGQSAQWSCK